MRTLALVVASIFVISSWHEAHAATAIAGQLVISEFRLRGPNGANDEYVVIYNNTNAAHTVTALSGTGYGVAASDGALRFSIPNGTVIPAHGHFLGTNSVGYSIGAYPAGSGTTATGDATYAVDIADNAGIALFNNNSGGGSFVLANRLDAVGSTSEANTLYKEGTGYPALTPFSINYAFYRTYIHGPPTPADATIDLTDGELRDTDVNSADFVFVDTNGTSAGAGQLLGAPGPANLSSPISAFHLNPNIGQALIDPAVAIGAAPNRVRDFTSVPANNSTFGTVDYRRTFTNKTGGNLTRLRFRIVKLTTFPAPSGVADLRPITSTDVVVSTSGGNKTARGTTLEQPPAQPNGGGWNSTFSVPTVTAGTPLANNASVDVRFVFGIQQTGTARFAVVVEGLPSASHFWFVTGSTETTADVEGFSVNSDAFVVTTAADENDAGATVAVPGGTGLSLREAITLANANPGPSTITFASPLFDAAQKITLTLGQLALTTDITINGPGADKLTVSGNNQDRIFSIAAGAAQVSISGMTIRDGKPTGGALGGGGIAISNGVAAGAVKLSALTITNNDASSAGNPLGGGIDNEGGTVTIDRCAIVNNTATFRGGAIQSQGFGSMAITSSTIAGNTAGTTGVGGAIRSLLPLTLTSCTIFGNSAQTAGNISRSGGTFDFGNTIIAGGILVGAGGTSPDLDGAALNSLDYNLIQDLTGATLTGATTHNITGVSPQLQTLANNGGTTPNMGPSGSSPVLDKGKSFGLATDQRGVARPADLPGIANATGGDGSDIGSVEGIVAGPPASITINAGNNQTAPVNTNVPIAPSVLVKDSVGTVVPGADVIFTVNTGGGTATGSPAKTDAGGVATLGSWKLGPTAGANTLGVTCAGAIPVTFTATGFYIPPVFDSNPTAVPNPVTVGQPVALTAAATSPSAAALTFAWDFGDGSTAPGAAVSHTYKVAGAYTATVTVTDGMTPKSFAVMEQVNPATALIGTGPDSDGDGFSDAFEIAFSADPNNPDQTPTGQLVSAVSIKPLALQKAGLKLTFSATGKDSISLSGTVDVPAGFKPAGTRMAFDVGGVVKSLTLDDKSSAKKGGDSVKLSVKAKKGVVAKQTAKFSAVFTKGAFAAALAASGFTNADAKKVTKTCTFTLLLNNDVLQTLQDMVYSAKKGKSGSAAATVKK